MISLMNSFNKKLKKIGKYFFNVVYSVMKIFCYRVKNMV